MARPVIVSDQGGMAETVEHGVTGWRVPPSDPAALADAMDLSAGPAAGGPRGPGRARPAPACIGSYTTRGDAERHHGRVSRAAGLKRILVIKLGALGDFVLAFAPFAAIRAHHPEAAITLLTTAPFADLATAVALVRRRAARCQAPLVGPARAAAPAPGAARVRHGLRSANLRPLRPGTTASPARPPWSGIAPGASHPHSNPARNAMHTLERQRDQLQAAGIAACPAPDLAWLGADPPSAAGAASLRPAGPRRRAAPARQALAGRPLRRPRRDPGPAAAKPR